MKKSFYKDSSFSIFDDMKYFFEKPSIFLSMYGTTYECDHPVYSSCTLYLINKNGLSVIQQRYDEKTKTTWWSEIDPWLTDAVYLHPDFPKIFKERSGACINGLYPTITIRQLMWALKMKPIPKERWETVFDRRDI